MFEEVSPKVNLPELEKKILAFWEENGIFKQSIEQRAEADEYVFYDGPPFATGLPHYGHLLAGTIKDIVPRYWTMQGKRVERRFGWDTHGLPVENEAAKGLRESEGLDLSGKYEIEEYGIGRFNEYCRSIVLKYTAEWETVVKRMGRWVDFENDYKTMDPNFMESIWYVFKQLWEKDLVYRGHRVMPFSWKLSTPLSNFEANSNYKEVQDPAITIKFALKDEPDTYILAWTTTPWTLPSNQALAVGVDIDYVKVKHPESGEYYILAEARREHYEQRLKLKFETVSTFKGSELVGKNYQPLFPYFADLEGCFRVIASIHVTTGDGAGVVHMAPAFGEDDYAACKEAGMPMVCPVDMEGRFTDEVTDFAGQNVKDADKNIIRQLKETGKLLLHETLTHSYPFCWRSDTPLIYRAISTWFCRVESFKDRLVANNKQVRWVPEAVGTNRFGNWLEDARDWNISRNRYWGTPIPLWECEETGDIIAVGSIADLEELTGQKVTDLHSHNIDELTFEKDGKLYKRIPEVFDCWFESGAMPYAQNHYPFENKEQFEANFPADFIAEGLDQTRGWFYTLMVLSTALFDKPAFKNVVVNGLMLAEDGKKMSKSLKNYPDPMQIIDQYGADCLRAYMIDSPVVRAEPLKFSEDHGVKITYRQVLLPLWNAYSFFVTYARLDGYKPEGDLTGSKNELDVWIISHLQSLIADVTTHMENNHLYSVIPELVGFIDQLTNWYIRRSRRRFWRAESDADKLDAYNTLYTVLVEFAKVMAPFLPFICEAIYKNLVRDEEAHDSVHLCDYPKPNQALIHKQVEEEMDRVRLAVERGRSLRAAHNLKVRQPLASLSIVVDDHQREIFERLGGIVREELNVKELIYLHDETELVHYAARPNMKVLGPRLGKALKVLNPAIRGLAHADIHKLLEEGKLDVEGYELTTEDFLIDRNEKEGMVVSSEGGITIALDTQLTDALKVEGDARELVNRIQTQRKEADFNVEDRIHLAIDADDWLTGCLAEYGDYVSGETLAASLNGDAFEPESTKEWDVNGKKVTVRLRRA
ncbi:MAG: isoleucine--tRNA ligase [Acidobacteriota bacterium]|nr:isoleucine--tRNA ligase [Acidobacteriota bacterium]